MKRALARSLIVLIVLQSASPAFATDYYVSPAGGGDGLSSGSRRTFASLFSTFDINGGDIIHAADGSYTTAGTCDGGYDAVFCVVTADGGSAGNPVVIVADNPCVQDGTDTPACSAVLQCAVDDGDTFPTTHEWAIKTNGASYVTVSGFEMRNCQNGAIFIDSGTNWIVENFYIHTIGREVCSSNTTGITGMFIQGANHTVRNGVFRDIGRRANGESGCGSAPSPFHLDHCIYATGTGDAPTADGLSVYNVIFTGCIRGTAFQIWNGSFDNIKLYQLTIRDQTNLSGGCTSGTPGQILIYPTGGGTASNVHITNVVTGNSLCQAVNFNTSGQTYSNVTVSYVQTDVDVTNFNDPDDPNDNSDTSMPAGITVSNSSIVADPKWVDGAAGNFNLLSDSPARDAGVELGAPWDEDMLGVARPIGAAYDIGALEFFVNDADRLRLR